jgi:hypothetical protein
MQTTKHCNCNETCICHYDAKTKQPPLQWKASCMKFEVIKVLMKNPVLRIWHHVDNTGVYFAGTCCLHHQSSPWTSRTVLLTNLIQLVLQVCWEIKFWQTITLVLTTENILWMCVIIFATDQLPWWHTTPGSLWSSDCILQCYWCNDWISPPLWSRFSLMQAALEPGCEFQCNLLNE